MGQDREAKKEYMRKWQAANREKCRAANKKHYEKNKEAIREQHRVYAKTHREEAKNRHRKWRAAHRDEINARSRRKRRENHPAVLEKERSWDAANRTKRRAYSQSYRERNPEKAKKAVREYLKELRMSNPLKVRDSKLRSQFGITLHQYVQMHDRQNGVCAICGEREPAIDKRTRQPRSLVVDHRHDTGQVRGLLCSRCNPGLGFFRDNPELLAKAIAYLNEWRTFHAKQQAG